jgi:hypothetical protein
MSQENVELDNVVVRRWFWAFENDTDAFLKVRDDKVVYIFDHEDRAAALEAAGLRE